MIALGPRGAGCNTKYRGTATEVLCRLSGLLLNIFVFYVCRCLAVIITGSLHEYFRWWMMVFIFPADWLLCIFSLLMQYGVDFVWGQKTDLPNFADGLMAALAPSDPIGTSLAHFNLTAYFTHNIGWWMAVIRGPVYGNCSSYERGKTFENKNRVYWFPMDALSWKWWMDVSLLSAIFQSKVISLFFLSTLFAIFFVSLFLMM